MQLERDDAEPQLHVGLKDELAKKGRVALYGIYFDLDKTTLRPASVAVLCEVLKLLQGDPGLSLTIEGHTDSQGVHEHNQALSEGRAASVKAWLVDHKVAGARLKTAGFGETRPVADNRTEDGRAKNRRVELAK